VSWRGHVLPTLFGIGFVAAIGMIGYVTSPPASEAQEVPAGDYAGVISFGDGAREVLHIDGDGTITVGPDSTPTEAAQEFVRIVREMGICKKESAK